MFTYSAPITLRVTLFSPPSAQTHHPRWVLSPVRTAAPSFRLYPVPGSNDRRFNPHRVACRTVRATPDASGRFPGVALRDVGHRVIREGNDRVRLPLHKEPQHRTPESLGEKPLWNSRQGDECSVRKKHPLSRASRAVLRRARFGMPQLEHAHIQPRSARPRRNDARFPC